MSHTCAANLAQYYGIRGRVVSTCAACVSGSQAIGMGFEAIRAGSADAMICGGAEELHWTHAGVFDVMMATSTRYNESPSESPRPFDADRDGLISENEWIDGYGPRESASGLYLSNGRTQTSC